MAMCRRGAAAALVLGLFLPLCWSALDALSFAVVAARPCRGSVAGLKSAGLDVPAESFGLFKQGISSGVSWGVLPAGALIALGCAALSRARALSSKHSQASSRLAFSRLVRSSVDTSRECGITQSRRREALAGLLVASQAPLCSARAESAADVGRLQRVVVTVGDKEAMDKEIKFWTEACEMKVLSDGVGSDGDGLRSVVFGFGSERSGDNFGIEIKVDPAVLGRRTPRLLNYSVMQPTVDAFCFLQIGGRGKVFDIFQRVENSGGSSLIGDARYVDVESPRGVPVRFVPRENANISVELIALNIEVPAFAPTLKFYKRVCNFEELKYPASEPPIQKLSALLQSSAGGPKLLLSPVPDGRVKERNLDEFENLVIVAPSAQAVFKAAESAVSLAAQEDKQREEDEKLKLQQTSGGKEFQRQGTQARPAAKMVDKRARIDDGVGNIIFVQDTADFERALA